MRNLQQILTLIALTTLVGTSWGMSPKPEATEMEGDVTVEKFTREGQVKRVTHDEVKEWMDTKTGEFVIIDVRTEEEFNQGHLPGAILVTVNEIATPKGQALLPNNLDMPLIVYCRSGNRSAQAAKQLADLGFNEIYDMGGLNGWKYGLDK